METARKRLWGREVFYFTGGVSMMRRARYVLAAYDDYILKNINLSVHKGECVLLCGKSGCGKSTLLKTINGIIPEFCNGEINRSVEVCIEDRKSVV